MQVKFHSLWYMTFNSIYTTFNTYNPSYMLASIVIWLCVIFGTAVICVFQEIGVHIGQKPPDCIYRCNPMLLIFYRNTKWEKGVQTVCFVTIISRTVWSEVYNLIPRHLTSFLLNSLGIHDDNSLDFNVFFWWEA